MERTPFCLNRDDSMRNPSIQQTARVNSDSHYWYRWIFSVFNISSRVKHPLGHLQGLLGKRVVVTGTQGNENRRPLQRRPAIPTWELQWDSPGWSEQPPEV